MLIHLSFQNQQKISGRGLVTWKPFQMQNASTASYNLKIKLAWYSNTIYNCNKKVKIEETLHFFPHTSCLVPKILGFLWQEKWLTRKFNFSCTLTGTRTSLTTDTSHYYKHTKNLVSILITSQITFFYNDLFLRHISFHLDTVFCWFLKNKALTMLDYSDVAPPSWKNTSQKYAFHCK